MRPLLFTLTPALAFGLGWLIAPDKVEDTASQADSALENSQSRFSKSSKHLLIESDSTDLGRYLITDNGQRVYAGPRDVSLFERVSRGLPNDYSALSEMMSQLSQMNDSELADAWADFSQQAPRGGQESALITSYVISRLQAAGMEVNIPPAWTVYAKELGPAIEADAVRRNPEKYLALLKNGEPLSSTQREVLLKNLARENPAEATRLWLEHSNLKQLSIESEALASLMTDPKNRDQLLTGIHDKIKNPVERETVLSGLLESWAFTNRDNLESFATSVTDPTLKKIASLSLLKAYSQFDPEKGLAYANQLEGPMREMAIGKSINILSIDNLERAKELADSMENPEDRLVAIRGLSYEMASQNYEAYQEWRDQLPPQEKEAVIKESFALYAGKEVGKAVDWLNEQPEGVEKEILKTELMRVYVADHAESVLGLLASFDHPYAKRNGAAIALQNSDPSDVSAIREILSVANDLSSGVNLSLPPGEQPAPLEASRTIPHNCSNCGHH